MPNITPRPLSSSPSIGQCSTIGLNNDRLQRPEVDRCAVFLRSPRNTATALGDGPTTAHTPSDYLLRPARPVTLNLMENPVSLQQQTPPSTAYASNKTVVSQSVNPMTEQIQQELRADRMRGYELLVARQPQRSLDSTVIIPLPRG